MPKSQSKSATRLAGLVRAVLEPEMSTLSECINNHVSIPKFGLVTWLVVIGLICRFQELSKVVTHGGRQYKYDSLNHLADNHPMLYDLELYSSS